ncbi:MAG: hypothetical protein P4L61_04040 [Candidatus Pacebacteria bacterium]|nr:hypothetical protein [Candidatus Paceibacterota bacterium]
MNPTSLSAIHALFRHPDEEMVCKKKKKKEKFKMDVSQSLSSLPVSMSHCISLCILFSLLPLRREDGGQRRRQTRKIVGDVGGMRTPHTHTHTHLHNPHTPHE